jgi:hypothetical protein
MKEVPRQKCELMNVSMVTSKNLESTFKTINLHLRRCHSFEQFKPIQTLNFSFAGYRKGKKLLKCISSTQMRKTYYQFTIKFKFLF